MYTEKCLNSAIATLLLTTLFSAYLSSYYVPSSHAQSISNGSIVNGSSSIINGSINNIPTDVNVTLFIVDYNSNNLLTFPIQGITSSNNNFSTPPISAGDGDAILFRINGKDSGIIIFHPGTTLTVQLQYTPPGSVDVTVVPIIPTPTATPSQITATTEPANVTAMPVITLEPTPALINTATPSAIANFPAATATSTPSIAIPAIYPFFYAIILSTIVLAVLIVSLRRL